MKKTIIIVSLLIFLAILVVGIVGCKPDYSTGSIVGSWVRGLSRFTFNEDGTFIHEYDDGDGFVERENGTYSVNGVKLTLDIDQYWDYSEGALVDDEEERKEIYTIGADEEKLVLYSMFYGGNLETMVGTWETHSKIESNNSIMENYMTIQLNDDGSYKITNEDNYSDGFDDIDDGLFKGRGEPTWELSEDGKQVILTGSEGTEEAVYIEIIGEGVYIDLFGAEYYTKQ